jgi:hypothetical protein
MGNVRNVHQVFMGISQGKRPFGRSRRVILKLSLRKIGWEVVGTGFICLSVWKRGGLL